MQLHVIGPLGGAAVAKCIMQIRLGIGQAACIKALLSTLCLQTADKSVVLLTSSLSLGIAVMTVTAAAVTYITTCSLFADLSIFHSSCLLPTETKCLAIEHLQV